MHSSQGYVLRCATQLKQRDCEYALTNYISSIIMIGLTYYTYSFLVAKCNTSYWRRDCFFFFSFLFCFVLFDLITVLWLTLWLHWKHVSNNQGCSQISQNEGWQGGGLMGTEMAALHRSMYIVSFRGLKKGLGFWLRAPDYTTDSNYANH